MDDRFGLIKSGGGGDLLMFWLADVATVRWGEVRSMCVFRGVWGRAWPDCRGDASRKLRERGPLRLARGWRYQIRLT